MDDFEQERQKLSEKVAEKNETIKGLTNRMETLEIEVVRTKQDLGEALNVVNEFELKNIALHEQLEKAMALKAQAEHVDNKKKGKK